ncbi:hypothetical protein BZL29_5456 [Mycobacterium kansasii]|uniref:Uncharacterized protein n=1 Tax=Mycobacterium kansasii TaxID=1768 RepID=A0A1V3WWS7_MYCKA|nr:hypothetical protein BZL29_5456 [Mycobacterium kansasii]
MIPGIGNLGKLPTWTELAALPDFLAASRACPVSASAT